MATVNIANLSFSHKGNYDGSTAYVKNDVVYYATNGNAYIAKQNTTGNAPTNGTYWSQFAAGSGGIWNAGLSLGSAGQVVKVNSGANALEFGTLSSDFVKLQEYSNLSATSGGYITFDFSSLFTTDYDTYMLMARGMWNNDQGQQLRARLNIGGSLKSDNYYKQIGTYNDGNSSGGSISADRRWDVGQFTIVWLDDTSATYESNMEMIFHKPTRTDTYNKISWRADGYDNNYLYQMDCHGHYRNGTGAIQGISFYSNGSANLDIRHATLYGLK